MADVGLTEGGERTAVGPGRAPRSPWPERLRRVPEWSRPPSEGAVGGGPGRGRAGAVLVLPAAGPDPGTGRRPCGAGAAGLADVAWQPAAERLVARGHIVLHRRASAERDHRDGLRAAARRGAHPGRVALRGGGAAGRAAGPGKRPRQRGCGPGAAGRGHHAGPLAARRDANPAAGTEPHRHHRSDPGHAADTRPGPGGAVVGAGGGGRDAGLGAGQRPARHLCRRFAGGAGLRGAGLLGDRPAAAGAPGPVV